MKVDVGHPDNFCGGNFSDWLEVNLTPACNAKCSWCVENAGWHPKKHATWQEICEEIIRNDRKNVILLGGEPSLHPHLKEIVRYLNNHQFNVYITTNGSRLYGILSHMEEFAGINVSIHHYDLEKNREITGLELQQYYLHDAITNLHQTETQVRFNCNLIKNYINSKEEILRYIDWAKQMGADSVRFAELKNDDDSFVDLAKILDYEHGLNDDPFNCGCNKNCVIDGMPVNFRQMCGMQTNLRPRPWNPRRIYKPVVYYDGKTYDGWQLKKEPDMNNENILRILRNVANGDLTPEEASELIEKEAKKDKSPVVEESSHCRY